MDKNYLISIFEQEYVEENLEKKESLRKQFVDEFPLDSIKDMELEKYALGKKQNSLSWWLEYNSVELGSIKGGTANKHKIFFSIKDNKWIYPKGFNNETDAWLKLRKELFDYINGFDSDNYTDIDPSTLIYSMNTVRAKLLYIYYPERLLPMYSAEHIVTALEFFGYKREEIKQWDCVRGNLELKKVQENDEIFKSWNSFKFMRFIYNIIIRNSKIYKIAPGDNAKFWDECFNSGYICMGWDDVGDMKSYADYNEFKFKFGQIYNDYDKSKITQKSNELWAFFNLNPGDIIVANKGTSKVVGIGIVNEKGYKYDTAREEYKHVVYVNWNKDFKEKSINSQDYWAFRTLYNISENLYNEIICQDNSSNKSKIIKETTQSIESRSENLLEIFTEAEEKFFIQIDNNLVRKGNIILYGPPGTGKTFLSNRYLIWKSKKNNNMVVKDFCTFHPSFNYEDFIEGYKPASSDGKSINFELKPGIFKDLCNRASKDKKRNYYLIIDEINRGNVEKIFGEMITLIERDKRGMTLTLSQSKEIFVVPENVYIIGTMNTTDRSIKMLDAAFRRRFAFIECMPDYDLINKVIDNLSLSPEDILKKINAKLREIEDREKQIGHSYFMKNGKQIDSIDELKEIYIYEIIPLISEYCFNDYSKMSEIIGEKFIDSDNEELKYEILNGNEDYFVSEIINQFGDKND